MKNLFVIAVLLITACSANGDSSQPDSTEKAIRLCEFDFNGVEGCTIKIDQQVVTISIESRPLADDEQELTHLIINHADGKQHLPISSGVSMIEGDRGYILFEDINFDQRPDVAITTSFGTPNLYLDYWTTAENAKDFDYVGNFPQLSVDQASRSLSAEERVNAANYQNTTWRWDNAQLVIQEESLQPPQ